MECMIYFGLYVLIGLIVFITKCVIFKYQHGKNAKNMWKRDPYNLPWAIMVSFIWPFSIIVYLGMVIMSLLKILVNHILGDEN